MHSLLQVLKDGIGQLGTLLFARTVSHRFDQHAKKWYSQIHHAREDQGSMRASPGYLAARARIYAAGRHSGRHLLLDCLQYF
jgi:hypothetical protein